MALVRRGPPPVRRLARGTDTIGVLVPKVEAERAEVIALEHARTSSAPPPLPETADEGMPAPG